MNYPKLGTYKSGGKSFIQEALKPRTTPEGGRRGAGSLTAAAKSAGKSIDEYCSNPPSALAKKRCNFRKTLGKLSKK